MADFAPNRTPRLKLGYRVQSTNHSFTWRLPRGTHIGDVGPFIDKQAAFLAAIAPILFSDWALQYNQYSEEDVTVFLPVALPTAPTGAGDTAGRQAENKANFIEFVGRGSAGSKTSFYLYGCTAEVTTAIVSDFRINTVENTHVSAAVGILTETPPNLYAIDDSPASWYPYVNFKANDHYVHKIRNGG